MVNTSIINAISTLVSGSDIHFDLKEECNKDLNSEKLFNLLRSNLTSKMIFCTRETNSAYQKER